MGAAGLTSSGVEMAGKGGMGVELVLDHVPQREEGMTAYEMMLSESQERMLMVLKPGRESQAEAIFRKWELDFAVCGRITDTGHMVIRHRGRVVADLPIDPLAKASPEYDRPTAPPLPQPVLAADALPADPAPLQSLVRLLASPDLCSKRWVWEQYDHMVMASTVGRPGGDAAVVRVFGTAKGLALTTDCTPRYCEADPRTGGRQAVAEAWRNLTAVGARPLAITDCLNFGNPEKPEIMGQFAECLAGMAEACRALSFPVVSGNVSFYNETNGRGIPPTPQVGGVGLLADVARLASPALKRDGDAILLLGDTRGWLGQSLWLREILGREAGAPPPVDLAEERRVGDLVRGLIEDQGIDTCHDIADGGLLVALAEMAIAGGRGFALLADAAGEAMPAAAWLFGEDQARYLVAAAPPMAAAIVDRAAAAGVPARVIGTAGGDRLTLAAGHAISLEAAARAQESWLPAYMAG
jgi:phosphoribosylformylglycinamidine synthase